MIMDNLEATTQVVHGIPSPAFEAGAVLEPWPPGRGHVLETGELRMRGYWDEPERTAEAIDPTRSAPITDPRS